MKIAGGAHVADHTWTKTMINLARRIHLKQKKSELFRQRGTNAMEPACPRKSACQCPRKSCTCERMVGRWTPEMCELCSMVLRMMLPHHCPHPEAGPTDERARMCPVRACAAVGRLCDRKCAADAGEPSGSGSTHPIRSIEQQRATSARPSARPRRLTASRDGPH